MKIKEKKLKKIINEEIRRFIFENEYDMPFGGGHLSKQVKDQPHGEKIDVERDKTGPFASLSKRQMVRILNEFMEYRRINKRKIEDFPDFDAHLAEKHIPHYSIGFKDKSKPYPANFEIFLAEDTSGDMYCMIFEGGVTADFLKNNKTKNSLYDTKIEGVNVNDNNLNIEKIAEVMLRSILRVIGY